MSEPLESPEFEGGLSCAADLPGSLMILLKKPGGQISPAAWSDIADSHFEYLDVMFSWHQHESSQQTLNRSGIGMLWLLVEHECQHFT